MIPYSRQDVQPEDIDAVVKVLKSDLLTQGPVAPAFEKAVCDKVGAKFAVAVNSGSSALHVACLALGLKPGDKVWTTPISFVATANCARHCGASVDFVDIDSKTFNMSISVLENKLEKATKLPKIVIPMHYAGYPCDMEKIYALSRQYGFYIIEDACHALGAKYDNDNWVGNCKYSDITVFSFHPLKSITSGEGGMATTNDSNLQWIMRLYSQNGIQKYTLDPKHNWEYYQPKLGYNYRMSDIHAALGLSQLSRLDEYIDNRMTLAAVYNTLTPMMVENISMQTWNKLSAHHLFPVLIENRDAILAYMRKKGYWVQVHYKPIYQFINYKDKRGYDCPVAEEFYQKELSLPLYPNFGGSNVGDVIKTLNEAMNGQS